MFVSIQQTSLWSVALVSLPFTLYTVTYIVFFLSLCQYLIPNQCCNEVHPLFSFSNSLSVFVSPSSSLSLLSLSFTLRRIASHVSLVIIAMLWGSLCLQENAGQVSSAWGVQIVLTLFWETAMEDRAQKVIRLLRIYIYL